MGKSRNDIKVRRSKGLEESLTVAKRMLRDKGGNKHALHALGEDEDYEVEVPTRVVIPKNTRSGDPRARHQKDNRREGPK